MEGEDIILHSYRFGKGCGRGMEPRALQGRMKQLGGAADEKNLSAEQSLAQENSWIP